MSARSLIAGIVSSPLGGLDGRDRHIRETTLIGGSMHTVELANARRHGLADRGEVTQVAILFAGTPTCWIIACPAAAPGGCMKYCAHDIARADPVVAAARAAGALGARARAAGDRGWADRRVGVVAHERRRRGGEPCVAGG